MGLPTLTQSQYAMVGRRVAKIHPNIVINVIEELGLNGVKKSERTIEEMFTIFCEHNGITKERVRSASFDQDINELNKVFICSVREIFKTDRSVISKVSIQINKTQTRIYNWISEINSRYRCDKSFIEKVDKTINLLK